MAGRYQATNARAARQQTFPILPIVGHSTLLAEAIPANRLTSTQVVTAPEDAIPQYPCCPRLRGRVLRQDASPGDAESANPDSSPGAGALGPLRCNGVRRLPNG